MRLPPILALSLLTLLVAPLDAASEEGKPAAKPAPPAQGLLPAKWLERPDHR